MRSAILQIESQLGKAMPLVIAIGLIWVNIRALKRGHIWALWVGPHWPKNWYLDRAKDSHAFKIQILLNFTLAAILFGIFVFALY